jgi:hypothetical protein
MNIEGERLMLDVQLFIKDDGSLNLSKLTKSQDGKQFLTEAIKIYGEAGAAQLAYRVLHKIDILPNCKTCNVQLTSKNFINFKQGYRSFCSNSCASKRSNNEYQIKLSEFSSNLILHSSVDHCTDIVQVTNSKCGHRFNVIYRNLFSNDNYCPVCGGKQRAKYATKIIMERSKEEIERLLPLVGTNYSTYLKVVRILTSKTYNNNLERVNPNGFTLSRYSYNLDHIVPIKECYRHSIDVYTAASIENLKVITAKENLSKKAKMIPEAMTLLNKWLSEEKTINSNSYNVNQLSLAQYMTELNSSIDVRIVKLSQNHRMEVGPIYIFEDEWMFKQKIVKSRLLSMVGKAKRVFARNCKIREVNDLEANSFCEHNHIQGSVSSSIRLGLYFNEEIVAIMTFGKPRFNKKYDWELLRYCTKLGTTVVGGASKLLTHFNKIKKDQETIITYADRRWSKGNLYRVLGFEELTPSTPGYFYIDQQKKKRINRVSAQKHKLLSLLGDKFDPSLTEFENMKRAGFDRVYDCGNLVFVQK